MISESEMLNRWAHRRDELKRLHASVDGALLCEEFIVELQELIESRRSATLTLSEASELTGYSRDHLSRLMRQGLLTNVGKKNKPRLVAGELPKRVKPVAAQSPAAYDPNTDARSLRVRR
jgi:hypothetical protein